MIIQEKIEEIKKIIDEWGSVSTGEMELESSPLYNYFSKDSYQLIEEFHKENIKVISYVHETEVGEFDVPYEILKYDLINEIYDIIKKYGEIQEGDYNRIQC